MAVGKQHIGQAVVDVDGRRGILMDIVPKWTNPADMPGDRVERPTAFVRSAGGGVEGCVSP